METVDSSGSGLPVPRPRVLPTDATHSPRTARGDSICLCFTVPVLSGGREDNGRAGDGRAREGSAGEGRDGESEVGETRSRSGGGTADNGRADDGRGEEGRARGGALAGPCGGRGGVVNSNELRLGKPSNSTVSGLSSSSPTSVEDDILSSTTPNATDIHSDGRRVELMRFGRSDRSRKGLLVLLAVSRKGNGTSLHEELSDTLLTNSLSMQASSGRSRRAAASSFLDFGAATRVCLSDHWD